jgi:hypothetical protein
MSANQIKETIEASNFSTNSLNGPGDIPGEKTKESLAVPNRWARNRATRKPMEIEVVFLFRLGTDNPRPTMAEVIETAGVSIPSANVRAVANSVCA